MSAGVSEKEYLSEHVVSNSRVNRLSVGAQEGLKS